jgi:ABC-type antimicrobial peptide transport system permease subunit
MFKNYLVTAIRSLRKNKVHSFINIAGLSVGMAVAMLIGLWVWDELSFDHYHQHHSRVAQVMDNETINGEVVTSEAIAIPLAQELRTKFASDFKNVAVMHPAFMHTLAVGDKKLKEQGVWAQPGLPEMLTLKMLSGRRNALSDPSSVLITHSLAVALFGRADPMNKVIKLDGMTEVKVGGVFEDLPENTSFNGVRLFLAWDKGISLLQWVREAQTQWDNRYWKLYVELNDNADIHAVNAKIKNVAKLHVKAHNEELVLHPMDNWHLYSEFKNGKTVGGRISNVWMFGITGLFVLLLACINFMNLSTACSAKRAKETGIRKVAGSRRWQLVVQFLCESLTVVFIASVFAVGLAVLLLPYFNSIAQKQMALPLAAPVFWLLLLGFAFFTGIVSGSYPAFWLSSFKPVKVLKGNFKAGPYASLPRKILITVQFVVSVALITGTIVVYRQLQFGRNRPVGYTRAGLITVTMNTADLSTVSYDVLRNALKQSGAVADMAQSSTRTTEAPDPQTDYTWKGKNPNIVPRIEAVGVTHDFGATVGWQVIAGRDFSRSIPADTGSIIINESAARLMGMAKPVGQTISWQGTAHIITGVVQDMVMESPYQPVMPTYFWLDYSWANTITLRLQPTMNVHDALQRVKTVLQKYNPGGPFEYSFTDDEYAAKFADEERTGNIAALAAVLAVFVSCLGLFGLASFIAEQRTKEIGVRKVLGASVLSIWHLLCKEFVVLVIISCCIALPLAGYGMHVWLQRYAYRAAIPWWIFASAGVGALLVTLLTVSWQSIKAALVNPAESLKTE